MTLVGFLRVLAKLLWFGVFLKGSVGLDGQMSIGTANGTAPARFAAKAVDPVEKPPLWKRPARVASMRTALADPKLDELRVVYPGSKRYTLDQRVEIVPLAELVHAQ